MAIVKLCLNVHAGSAGHLDGRMVAMVWTRRAENHHDISMRYCHAKEEKRWAAVFG